MHFLFSGLWYYLKASIPKMFLLENYFDEAHYTLNLNVKLLSSHKCHTSYMDIIVELLYVFFASGTNFRYKLKIGVADFTRLFLSHFSI